MAILTFLEYAKMRIARREGKRPRKPIHDLLNDMNADMASLEEKSCGEDIFRYIYRQGCEGCCDALKQLWISYCRTCKAKGLEHEYRDRLDGKFWVYKQK